MASQASTLNSKNVNATAREVPSSSNGSDHLARPVPISSQSSWRMSQHPLPGQRSRQNTDPGLDDYFVGPRDMSRHSKWPFFMRMHGSVLPKMILPLIVIALWSTLITLISHYLFELKISSLLLTVLGFVVGMAISFRTSTAYERYAEGRKYWSQMMLVGQNLGRTIWIHAGEREGQAGKEDLLMKISALNLIVAFAIAVKHKLRFEPGIDYEDLKDRIEYLETFAKEAEAEIPKAKEYGKMKAMGEYLGVTFAESNPRKRIKRSKKPLGNLPMEILNHLAAYVHTLGSNESFKIGLYHNQAINSVVALNEIAVGVERVLQTPLPIAYSIAISQITWVYVLMLPFQLWDSLRFVTIPGCIFAAYIILGISAIGREIENPFGMDVNDLPLEAYCEELEMDIDIIMSQPPPDPKEFMRKRLNMPIYPLSHSGFTDWLDRPKEDIRDALMSKTKADMKVRKSIAVERASSDEKQAALMQEA